jgi:surfactin synthase thioesterase subunit
MRKIVNFSDIDRNTPEGRLLAAAIMIVSTTPGHTHKSRDQVLDSINELADEMSSHNKPMVTYDQSLGPTGHGDECMSDADNGL